MKAGIWLGMILGLFFIGANFTAAEDKPSTTPVKKERVVKKKKIIKNKTAAKKSVPLGTAAPAPTQKVENKSTSNWIKELKKKLAKSQARQNQIVAVAAVRGNETPDSPPLYWKGKKSSGELAMTEVGEFDMALDSALKGNSQESIQSLQSFITKYPNSPLVEDAKEAIVKLAEDTPINP